MSAASLIVHVVWLLCVASALKDDSLVVHTTKGSLRGSILRSLHGRDIYSFRGVRYAQPPTGSRRLQPPVDVEPWDGILNATEDGAICLQLEEDIYPIPQSEDCLFLNVYTTELPNSTYNPRRPVVVYFHEGAWVFSAGHSALRGPQYLADQDIVLVTLNFRLGALGFLSTGDDILPGNYGLKDQVAALRWVKQNIDVFGGDPDSVTIMGYSAGSHSVLLHMISPLSKGLFHRSIAMSGAMFQRWAVRTDQITVARRHAAILGCTSNSSEEIHQCFMNARGEDIATSVGGLREWSYDPLAYTPVIEAGDNAFLNGDPTELYLAGDFAQVPVMLGVTKNEFDWRSMQILTNDSLLNDINENFYAVAPVAFSYSRDTTDPDHVSTVLREFYMNNKSLTNDSLMQFGRIYSDSLVNFGMNRAAKFISEKNSKPVYYYCFEYEGRYSYIYKLGTLTPLGVSHHDDTIYLFYNSVTFPFFTSTDPEYSEVDKLTKLWANFIKTGNPTPDKDELLDNVTWTAFTTADQFYLEHGSQLQMKQRLFKDRIDLWESLFPLSGTDNSEVSH